MKTYYVAGIPYSDELYHFGIKGQKWGIRRYQNPDGTLTPAGKARYGTDVTNLKPKELRKQVDSSSKAKRLVKTDRVINEMNDRIKSTDEFKRYHDYAKNLNEVRDQLAKQMGVSKDRIVFDDYTVHTYTRMEREAMSKAKKIYEDYKDKLASALLKDLDYEITDAGKEYVKKYICVG